MNKLLLATVAMFSLGLASASAGVHVGVTFGGGGYYPYHHHYYGGYYGPAYYGPAYYGPDYGPYYDGGGTVVYGVPGYYHGHYYHHYWHHGYRR
jgi:hypothetical protein